MQGVISAVNYEAFFIEVGERLKMNHGHQTHDACVYQLSSTLLRCCLFFNFSPICNFGKFSNFGLGTRRSERVKQTYVGFVISVSVFTVPPIHAVLNTMVLK